MIPLFGVMNTFQVEEAAIGVLRSGAIASGEYVTRFENGIGAITGQQHVVSTVDMTSAMLLALHLAGVRPGDEVLTTAFACMATNAAIAQCGAIPVWVDVERDGVHMSVDDAAAKTTVKTKAAILYHVAGYPGPARELAELCRPLGIALIEDCNNALFATRNGRHVGSEGDFSVYSFYPNRQINCAEGGALICKDLKTDERARRLRRFGINSKTFRTESGEINPSSDIPEIGWAITMNNLCAAIGTAQLTSARDAVMQARANVGLLRERLAQIDGLRPVVPICGADPSYWVMLLFVDRRNDVLHALKQKSVMASSLHQRNDGYSGFIRSNVTSLPNTDYVQDHILAIPCGWWLGPSDIHEISDALQGAAARAAHC